MENHIPLVIAHRGAAGEAPENTLAAFQLALDQGCDGFELDVHLSKDGEIIVIHDATLDRTTNGTGKVQEMTLTELRRFDAGCKFSSNYAGEQIPLLEEVFALSPSELIINVEVKGGIGCGMEEALVALLRTANRLETVIVSSFDHKCLATMKQIEPTIKVGLLYNLRTLHHWKLPEVAGCDVYSLHPNMSWLDAEDVNAALEKGFSIYPWTVNAEASLRQAIAYGVSGIITDYPGRARDLLNQKEPSLNEGE